MPGYEIISGLSLDQVCDVAYRWRVEPRVMKLVCAAATEFKQETGRDVRIISGYRSAAEQAQLKREGRPTAAPNLSNHLSCPATAVDITAGFGVTNAMKAIWGRIVTMRGLRWGYGAPNRSTGIPEGWNHVDTGPRSTQPASTVVLR